MLVHVTFWVPLPPTLDLRMGRAAMEDALIAQIQSFARQAWPDPGTPHDHAFALTVDYFHTTVLSDVDAFLTLIEEALSGSVFDRDDHIVTRIMRQGLRASPFEIHGLGPGLARALLTGRDFLQISLSPAPVDPEEWLWYASGVNYRTIVQTSVAEVQRRYGATVRVNPPRESLPAPLQPFALALVSYEAHWRVVLEVHSRETLYSATYLPAVAQATQFLPEWRVDLIIVEALGRFW